MRTKRLSWTLFTTYLLIAAVPLLIAAWVCSALFSRYCLELSAANQKAEAYHAGKRLEPLLQSGQSALIDSLCKEIFRMTETRMTVILPSGRVIGDSERDPDSMENHANRPEVLAALAGKMGQAQRVSATVGERMLYVALPIYKGASVIAVVRASRHVARINRDITSFYHRVFAGVAVLALLCALIGLSLSRRIGGPIGEMKRGAQRFAQGELEFKVQGSRYTELSELSAALNEMAELLGERIKIITQQRNERDTILSSMMEGIIAVDGDQKIISINRTASAILGINAEGSRGRKIYEATRHSAVHTLVTETLASSAPVEHAISLLSSRRGADDREIHLQARGTSLQDADGRIIGALVMLNDVTTLHRLENLRKDFVANVSHELRTPLTSLKGFAETLLSGTLDDKAETRRFLEIMASQIDRLSSIMEDLLALSAIEKGAENGDMQFVDGKIQDILFAAVNDYQARAAEKGIRVLISCAADVRGRISESLLQQAVGNLLDNAIKYSQAGQTVNIDASSTDTGTRISVKDSGAGIAEEHIGRLFERFYRVDKARSRKLGGTGLGLSIVKHIVTAHHGTVSVESAPGKGSTFSIHLPKSNLSGSNDQRST